MSKEQSSDESMMMRKKFPGAKIVIDYCVKIVGKRIELMVVALLLGGGLSVYSDKHQDSHGKIELWQEVGPHLSDAHNEIWSNINATAKEEIEISNLVKRVELLERK